MFSSVPSLSCWYAQPEPWQLGHDVVRSTGCLLGRRLASSLNWYSDGQRVLPSLFHLSNSWRMSPGSMLRAMAVFTHSSSTLSSAFHGGVAGRIAFAILSNVCFASLVSTGSLLLGFVPRRRRSPV